MGSEVGTTTFSLVGVGSSPPPTPPLVVVRLTGVVPEPPDVSISAANAETDRAQIMQRARHREIIFFIQAPFLPYGYKDDLGDDLGRGIPFHDENNGGDGSLSHGRGQWGYDGAVFHIYLVAGTAAHAG